MKAYLVAMNSESETWAGVFGTSEQAGDQIKKIIKKHSKTFDYWVIDNKHIENPADLVLRKSIHRINTGDCEIMIFYHEADLDSTKNKMHRFQAV